MDIGIILKYASLYAEAASQLKGVELPLYCISANHPRADYMREYMANRYHDTRKKVIDRLGGRCVRCGSREGPFHLDHIDKKKKKMRASDLHSVNDKKFEKEMKNLQLLCRDCHVEKTNQAWDYGSNVMRPRHNTYWMYKKYRCRCPGCVKAYTDKQKEWRDKAKNK